MIVETDFLDHWKTQLLRDTLGGDIAVLVVLRIWGHCQQRKAFRFAFTPETIKAITRWPGPAEVLLPALVSAGFLVQEDSGLYYVHQWDVTNAFLVNAWTNGAKGGRPKVSPEKSGATELPAETQKKPVGYRRVSAGVSQSKAIDMIDRIDRIDVSVKRTHSPVQDSVFPPEGIHSRLSAHLIAKSPLLAELTPNVLSATVLLSDRFLRMPEDVLFAAADDFASAANSGEEFKTSLAKALHTYVGNAYKQWDRDEAFKVRTSSATGGSHNPLKNEPRGGPRESPDSVWNALATRDTSDPDTPASAAAARLLRARGPAALPSTAKPAT